jgi:hypothetical protein
MKLMRYSSVLVGISLLALLAVSAVVSHEHILNLFFAHVITVQEHTDGCLEFTRSRILTYVSDHHCPPITLSDLPGSDGDKAIDGWGNPLIYQPQSDGSIVLRSLGNDRGTTTCSMRFSIIDPTDEKEGAAMLDTFLRMYRIRSFLKHYVADHQRLPDILPTSYPEPLGFDLPHDGVDGWGRPISYTARSNGSVLLNSHGVDGKQCFSLEFILPGVGGN